MGRAGTSPVREFVGQEGSRWINARPTGPEVAEWFKTIKLHDNMEHENYVNGIVLISATEDIDLVLEDPNGNKALGKRSQIVYTPYPKVETRVAYYLDWLAAHPDLVGRIEPVKVKPTPALTAVPSSEGLPPGFFYNAVKHEKGITVYICYAARVVVYEKQGYADMIGGKETMPVLDATGTKQVPLLRYPDRADDNAMMKAETGGKGRALGFAGMLIVPGAGVATAEDMQEAQGQGGAPVSEEEAEAAPLPPGDPAEAARQVEEGEAKLRADAEATIKTLKADFPAAWETITEWARSRNYTRLGDLNGPALKGFARKLEKTLDDARMAARSRGEGEDPLEDAPEPQEPSEAPPDG